MYRGIAIGIGPIGLAAGYDGRLRVAVAWRWGLGRPAALAAHDAFLRRLS